jgi:carbamoyltransferase
MKLLSLRLCGHDSNISYFDGKIVRYYRSEREFQIKHHAFNNLWEWRDVVKRIWNLDYRTVDQIAVILEPHKYNLPNASQDIFPYIEYDLFPSKSVVYRLDHHYAHSLSTWMLHKEEPSIHFVIDGAGDADTGTSWSIIKQDKLLKRGSLNESDSIGRKIVELGDFLGIPRTKAANPIDGLDTAGKLMSLQSHGKINFNFIENYLSSHNFYYQENVFNFNDWIKFKNDERLACHSALDWAATVHFYIGEMICNFFKEHANISDYISYTGGVAQNIIWNTKLKTVFPNLIIPPHCGDDGLSLGGIEFLRKINNLPQFEIENFPYVQSDEDADFPSETTIHETARLLSLGKIIAWYQGNGEIGPRALGNRSILADPRIDGMKSRINKIKKRENYRPFGASMISKLSQDFFEIPFEDNFMLYTYKVKSDSLKEITHIDGTCRVQCVDKNNKSFYNLINTFFNLTGCPVLLNTSLNVNGRPIAAHQKDVIEFFWQSDLDYLVIGNKILGK